MAERRDHEARPPATPISAGRDAAAFALRAFADATARSAPPEEPAWRSVEARLDEGPRVRFRGLVAPRGWAALALGTAGVVLLALRMQPPLPVSDASDDALLAPAAPVAAAPAAAATTVDERPTVARRPSTPAPAQTLALGTIARPLPVGSTELAGEAVVTLARGSAAVAKAEASRTIVRLQRGSATFDVVPGRSGRAFRVEAGAYAFEVLGTVFEVDATDAVSKSVALRVREGRVAVLRGTRRLATVTTGGRWTARERRAPALMPDPVAATGNEDPSVRCAGDVAAGDNKGAIHCYEAVARAQRPGSEEALVMAARLRADGGDASGAVELLRSHADRFPDGDLDDEVKLMLIELLPTVGWQKEALALSGSYLASDAGQQHRSEILLLRGHIYRRLGSCASALGEYRAAAEGARSRASDEGAFFHALCLHAVGRLPDARRAYWEYLLRPGAARAAEARRRVDHLE